MPAFFLGQTGPVLANDVGESCFHLSIFNAASRILSLGFASRCQGRRGGRGARSDRGERSCKGDRQTLAEAAGRDGILHGRSNRVTRGKHERRCVGNGAYGLVNNSPTAT